MLNQPDLFELLSTFHLLASSAQPDPKNKSIVIFAVSPVPLSIDCDTTFAQYTCPSPPPQSQPFVRQLLMSLSAPVSSGFALTTAMHQECSPGNHFNQTMTVSVFNLAPAAGCSPSAANLQRPLSPPSFLPSAHSQLPLVSSRLTNTTILRTLVGFCYTSKPVLLCPCD